jgi:hypothetical protein
MITQNDLTTILKGFFVREQKETGKSINVILQSANRTLTSQEIRTKLDHARIKYVHARFAGSSFPSVEFDVGTKRCRVLFKEDSSSKAGLNTSLMECAQCLYMAAYQIARKPIDSTFVQNNLPRIRSLINIDSDVTKVLDAMDASWRKSSEIIANHLGPKLRASDYVFHRNSTIVQSIYKKYAELNRTDRIFNHPDKWNPADIWAIRRSAMLTLNDVGSWDEFNQKLRQLIDSNAMIPISLKKVVKSPKLVTANTSDAMKKMAATEHPVEKTEYVGFKVSTGTSDWTSSKNCKIMMKKGTQVIDVEVRQSKGGAQINGELKIKKTAARHGKIHMNSFVSIFKGFHVVLQVPTQRELNKASADLDPQLIDDTYALASKLDRTSHVTLQSFTDFVHNKGKSDPDWLGSKYGALLVVEAFSKLSDSDKNKACSRLYSTAAASNDLAGPYLKVTERV